MSKARSMQAKLFLSLGMLVGLFANPGCQFQVPYVSKRQTLPPHISKVVVAGFYAASSQKDGHDVIQDPISDTSFAAEPVPKDTLQRLSGLLFEKVSIEKGFECVSPDQAKWAYSRIVRSDQDLGASSLEMLQKLGDSFEADAVLAGYIYRWRDREGSDFAASRPASVAFSLLLISSAEGRVLWRGRFDKTQLSLSENVLDFATFRETGGRWTTAEKLSLLGIQNLLTEMPDKGKANAPSEPSEGGGP